MTSTVDIPIKFAEPGFLGLGVNALTMFFFAIAAFAAVLGIIMLIRKGQVKKLSSSCEASGQTSIANNAKAIKIILIVSAIVFVLGLLAACFTIFSGKALADESEAINADPVVMSIDSRSEINTVEAGSITNNTSENVKINYIQVQKASGVNKVNSNCVITLKAGDSIIYSGGPADQGHIFDLSGQAELISANGGSVSLSADIQGLSKDEMSQIITNNEPVVLTANISEASANDTQTQETATQSSQDVTITDQQVISSLNVSTFDDSLALNQSTNSSAIDNSNNNAANNNSDADYLKKLHITVKCPSTQLVYTGQHKILGYVYAYFYNSQGRKVPVVGHYYYSLNDGPYNESRFAEAINAGEYTIRYKVTAPGCEDAEGVFINNIAKAENQMALDINQDSIVSCESSDSQSIFLPVSCAGCTENLV